MEKKRPLTWEEQDRINQVIATFAISGMTLPEEAIRNLEAIVRGEKTAEDIIRELDEEYGTSQDDSGCSPQKTP